MRASGLLALVVLVSGGGGGALAQDAGDAGKGHDFAQEVCAECHAVETDMDSSPFSPAPTFKEVANVPCMTATALRFVLQNPHRQMPDLILRPEDLRHVVAYILTLKNDD